MIEPVSESWFDAASRPPSLAPEGATIIEAFLNTCKRMGKACACADESVGILDYRSLRTQVIVLASWLKERDEPRIGILFPASCAAGICILATLLAGKEPVMLNWTLGEKNLNAVLELSSLKTVLTSESFLQKIESTRLGNLEKILVCLEDVKKFVGLGRKISSLFESMKSTESILCDFNCSQDENSPAVILFTSGSETQPKGVPLSHKNILANILGVRDVFPFERSDVIFGFLPPFHSFGFTITTLCPLLLGVRVAYHPNPLERTRLAHKIAQYKATIAFGTPSFYMGILKAGLEKELQSMRLFVTGAEKAPEQLFNLVAALQNNSQVLEGYGTTECSPVISVNRPFLPKKGVGKPFLGTEILICDPNTLKPLPQSEKGLILCRGNNVFNGYLNGEPNPFLKVGEHFYYNTGDLGYLDSDGNIHLCGRIRRFVKVGGEMVSLPAIEEVLHHHCCKEETEPAIAVESLEQEGDKPLLCLFTSKEHISLKNANEILKIAGLSNIHRIHKWKHLERIPLLGSGKVDYRSLKKILEQELGSITSQ